MPRPSSRHGFEPRSRGFCLLPFHLCLSVFICGCFYVFRVDNFICGYNFDALLSPFGYQAVAAFGNDGLCGVQDEIDGRCVAF